MTRISQPFLSADTNKENLQLPNNLSSVRRRNLSGDGGKDHGDFSISSMSDSSHRANKSTLNANCNFSKIFGRNYFVDGE